MSYASQSDTVGGADQDDVTEVTDIGTPSDPSEDAPTPTSPDELGQDEYDLDDEEDIEYDIDDDEEE